LYPAAADTRRLPTKKYLPEVLPRGGGDFPGQIRGQKQFLYVNSVFHAGDIIIERQYFPGVYSL